MGLSTWELLIILVIVALLFGTKKLRNIGGDLGGAIKGFRSAMKDGEADRQEAPDETGNKSNNVIEGEVDTEEKGSGKPQGQ